jgi:hypothetical protein
MGEQAEMILEGEICRICGVWLDGTPPGYPRVCEDCADDPIAIAEGLPVAPEREDEDA